MSVITDSQKIRELLTRGVEEVIVKEHLETALKSGRQLRVKFGIDPTAPDIHLGHSVPLRKLKQFQDLGHQIVLLIGDFTAKIGDPSGRSEARKPLTDEEVKKNMEGYLAQAGNIIDVANAEVVYNSSWFAQEGIAKAIELATAGSVQQVLRRADFRKRLDEGHDLTLLEVLYPLFQGYDSVRVKADVEIGGTDQLFNLLMGRRVQRHYNMPEQDVLTTLLLEGTDGAKKMSKSAGNYIGLTEEPNLMFGKIMSLPDNLITKYFLLCTDVFEDEIKTMAADIGSGKSNPRDAKLKLACEIVKIYHGEKEADNAAGWFEKVFSRKELPTEIPEHKISSNSISLVDLIIEAGLAKSRADAKRLVEQSGVEIDGAVKNDWGEKIEFKGGEIIQAGKRRFVKIRI